MYFMGPVTLLSLLGCYFPYVYVMLAVNESDICLCSYYLSKSNSNRSFLFFGGDPDDYNNLQLINLYTSRIWICALFAAIFVMVYRIRHI
jgi:hypothetical protein